MNLLSVSSLTLLLWFQHHFGYSGSLIVFSVQVEFLSLNLFNIFIEYLQVYWYFLLPVLRNLLLSPSSKFFILDILFNCTFSVLLINSISLLIFFILWVFLIFSFYSLNIFTILELMSLSSKSNIWASLGTGSIGRSFFLCMDYMFCFWYVL